MTRWVKDKKGKFLGSVPGEVKPPTPQDPAISKLIAVVEPEPKKDIAEMHTSFKSLLDEYKAQASESPTGNRTLLSEKYDEAIKWIRKYPNKKIDAIHSIMTRSAWMAGRNATRKLVNSLTPEQVYEWLMSKPRADKNKTISEMASIFGTTEEEMLNHIENNSFSPLARDQKNILARIDSLWEDQGMKSTKVLGEAKKGGYVISSLQKNPTKQNIYETTVAAYLQEKTDTPVLILASARNKISLRFSADGNYDVSGKSKDGFTKDADLAIIVPHGEDGVKVFLASHKYGRSTGGHQDNQKKDAAAFLSGAENALKTHKDIPELREVVSKSLGRNIPKSKFSWEPALILDGEFFSGVDEWIAARTYDHSNTERTSRKERFVGDADQFISFLSAMGIKKSPKA